MNPATKRTAVIVGVSALSVGLLLGTGFAADAGTTGIATALHQTSSVSSIGDTTPTSTAQAAGMGWDLPTSGTDYDFGKFGSYRIRFRATQRPTSTH